MVPKSVSAGTGATLAPTLTLMPGSTKAAWAGGGLAGAITDPCRGLTMLGGRPTGVGMGGLVAVTGGAGVTVVVVVAVPALGSGAGSGAGAGTGAGAGAGWAATGVLGGGAD